MASSLTPKSLRGIWPDFDWENERVWAVKAPVTELAVSKLVWHLDQPLWSSRPPEPLFDLRPREVLDAPERHPGHARRIREASLEFPLDLFEYRGRWVILDGLHRLARLVCEGAACARVRRLPACAQEQIKRTP